MGIGWSIFSNEDMKNINDIKDAAMNNQVEYLEYLLDNSFKGKRYDYDEMFLPKGRLYNFKNKLTDILIECSFNDKNEEIILMLIKAGANVHTENDIILINSIVFNRRSLMESLLLRGADICAQNGQVLIKAATHCSLDTVKFLVDHGATISNLDEPIRCAYRRDDFEMVKYLKSLMNPLK